MSSIVLKSLSILLGLFFIFVGTMKVTSAISKDLHKDLVSYPLLIIGSFQNNDTKGRLTKKKKQRERDFYSLICIIDVTSEGNEGKGISSSLINMT